MKIKQILTLACAGLVLAACSNDDGIRTEGPIDGVTNEAEEAYLSFRINLPKTKAYGTDPGESYEQTVNSLNVYIYDADNLSAAPVVKSISSFAVTDDTGAIKVKKSDKLVLVGVNLPNAITNHITSTHGDAYTAFTYSGPVAVSIPDVATNNSFVMFNENLASAKVSQSNLYDTEALAEANPVTLDVARVVAKATVSLGLADVPVTGGTVDFDNMEYGWRNVNRYLTLVTDNTTGYKDSNWSPSSTNYSDFSATGAGDLAVNDYNATINSFAYTTENTFDLSAGAKVKDATYLSIKTKFIPEQVWISNGGSAGDLSDFDLATNSNYPSTAVDFWIVELNNGTTNYFLDQATAIDFAAAAAGEGLFNGTYVPADKKYTDGTSYYHVFVNTAPETDSQNRGYTQFNVYRNQYYKVLVNAINGPGLPDDTDDEEDPLKPSAYIDVQINVLDWTTVEEPVILE